MTSRIGERQQLQESRLLYRELTIERAAAASEGAIRVAISTDAEIMRQGWLGDLWGETLGHGRDEVRLGRLQDAGPLLLDHDRRMHIGVLERVKLERSVIRADLRFSRAAHAQEVEADVRDGIRAKLSVGYLIWEVRLEAVDQDDVEHYRITDWEPLEASLVSIPADLGAGVGRSHVAGEAPRVRYTERRSGSAVTTPHPPTSPRRRREAWRDYLR